MVTQEQATSLPSASGVSACKQCSLVLPLLWLALVLSVFVVVAVIIFILIVLTIFFSVLEFLLAVLAKVAFAIEELLLSDAPAL